MILRYSRYVVFPALGWALFMGCGFIGIGGFDLPVVVSDQALKHFWYLGGLFALIAFVVAVAILTRDAVRLGLLRRYAT